MTKGPDIPGRRRRGFEPAAGLLRERIRSAGEARGFAVSRLLTQWPEVVGDEIAAMARPIKVSYGKGTMGATLTLLTTGSAAPMLQMQLPRIRERVNACYGYNAISRIAITQTAPTGFADGQAQFEPATRKAAISPSPEVAAAAHMASIGVKNDDLRAALEALGQNVLSRPGNRKG